MSAEPALDMKQIEGVLDRYQRGETSALVHLLQEVQSELNYLPGPAIEAVAEYLNVPLTKAYSVATFYKAFSLTPRGKTIIKICMGTTCHIRGAGLVVEDIKDHLGISPGETTEDMEFTAEIVNCVGACALAPVVIAGNKYLADVKPGTIEKRLKEV